MYPSIGSHRTTGLPTMLAVLAVLFLIGLMLSAPAGAQGPEDASRMIQSGPPSSILTSEVESTAISPADHIPPPGSTGYLHVHVYDELSGQPLGSRAISIYNRAGDQVGHVTTTCQGYVEFNALPSGPYRVILEADPDWVTARRSNFPGGRNTTGEWVWVRPYWRVGVDFFELPNIAGAGLRIYAYDVNSRQANRPREPLAGAAFTIYDASGNFVANGVTGCGGFVDFNNLSAGQYRIVDANWAEGTPGYPLSGERWISLQYGALTSAWFFTVPSPGPEATPTP